MKWKIEWERKLKHISIHVIVYKYQNKYLHFVLILIVAHKMAYLSISWVISFFFNLIFFSPPYMINIWDYYTLHIFLLLRFSVVPA